MCSIVQSVEKFKAIPLGPMLLKMLPSCEVFAQASVKVPSMSQKEDCTYRIGFWKREKLLFSHGIGFFFFFKGICVIKEVGESFLGRNSSKCLVVLISSLWHFWQTGEREIKLLGGQLFHVVRLGDWKKQKSASFNLESLIL